MEQTEFDWTGYQQRFDELETTAAREAGQHLWLLDRLPLDELFSLYELPDAV